MAFVLTKGRRARHDKLVQKPMKTCILFTALAAASYGQLLPGDVHDVTSAPAGEIKPDTVVAIIAGTSVTAGDVGKLMKYAPPNLVEIFKQNPQEALRQAFLMKELEQQALGLHLDQQEPTKDTLEAVLGWQKENILAGAMVNQLDNGYNVTEDEINQFYKSHQSRYQEANIKIIMIGFKPAPAGGAIKEGESADDAVKRAAESITAAEHSLNDRSEADARKLADDLVKQLRAGADFAALVAKYSDDKESKASGGDFGVPIKATSSFAPEIKKVVFELKEGQVADPLRQANSYYIIKLEKMNVEPLDDVHAAIGTEIRANHMNDTVNELSKRFTPQVLRPDFFIQAQKQAAGK